MNKIIIVLSLAFALIELKAQSTVQVSAQMPKLIRIDTVFVGTEISAVAETGSMPPHYIYGITGYKYQITLHLFLVDSTKTIDTSLVLFSASTYNRNFQMSKIHISNLVKVSSQHYTYSLLMVIRNEGITDFALTTATISELRDKRFYNIVNLTNKQSVYFSVPIK
jgi:hypothetical protein